MNKQTKDAMYYTKEEVYAASIEYFDGDELAARVFVDKYALADNEQRYLERTPNDMHRRIAREIARIEATKYKKPLTEDEVFDLIKDFKRIVFQGSPMYGIGNDFQQVTIGNCYALAPVQDTYASIFRTDESIAQVCKRRGGCGVDVSALRPKGLPVHNAARSSVGALPFMRRFSGTTKEVCMEGRRGALMLLMSVHHPEIMDFISAKNNQDAITGANMSTMISDEFMSAVMNDTDYTQRWPAENPKMVVETSAKTVWNSLVKSARNFAEPGALFWDTILRNLPSECYADKGFKTSATNPCGEVPMSEDACRLMSMNLYSYVINPFTNEAKFDFKAFRADAILAQRLSDDLVDLDIEKMERIIKKIKRDDTDKLDKAREIGMWKTYIKSATEGRRTGTGFTGLGDTLAALGLSYGSAASIEKTSEIAQTFKLACYRSSVEMAKELGAFPIYDARAEDSCEFIARIKHDDPKIFTDMEKYGRRNISILTCAPAGSVSLLTQTTSGIEPAFCLSYSRKRRVSSDNPNASFTDANGESFESYDVDHHKVQVWKSVTGKQDITKSPWHGCCSHDIPWNQRVAMQAAITRQIDHAVSSTVNLPSDVTEEEVSNIFLEAYKSGCKGITVYRDGSRDSILSSTDSDSVDHRPRELECDVHHVTVHGEKYFVFVGLRDNKPYEVFVGKDNIGISSVSNGIIKRKRKGVYQLIVADEVLIDDITQHVSDEEEALARLISTNLRFNVNMEFIADQLNKTKGVLFGFSKSVARVLNKYIKDGTDTGQECPECGTTLVHQSGCVGCMNCGFSKCM